MTEEAKRAVEILRHCSSGNDGTICEKCHSGFRDEDDESCVNILFRASANLIESLSAELEQVKKERDAAVEELKGDSFCRTCEHYGDGDYISNDCHDCINRCNWQWRGVKE